MSSRIVSAEEARGLLAEGRMLRCVIPQGPQDDGTYLLCLDDDADTDIGRAWTSDDANRIACAVDVAPDLAATVLALSEERDRLRRLVALAKSYRDCNRNDPEADTTDDEIATMVHAEIDAETALFDALDAHDADRAAGEVSGE